MRTDPEAQSPPKEKTATSVVPAPHSITIEPAGPPPASRRPWRQPEVRPPISLRQVSHRQRPSIRHCAQPGLHQLAHRRWPAAQSVGSSLQPTPSRSNRFAASMSCSTPRPSGRLIWRLIGVRSTMAWAPAPAATKSIDPTVREKQQSDGSSNTMPSSRRMTRRFAVPKSIAISGRLQERVETIEARFSRPRALCPGP